MADDDIIIRVQDLQTRFGDTVVHDKLSLDVRRGEILAIVGGSGSGKTVLLRQMILLDRPRHGRIELLGRDCTRPRASDLRWIRERVGVLFQQGALFTGMTVLENVMLPLLEHSRLSRATIEELAMLRISMAGLPTSASGKYPSELSGGMVKRAALARALALDPDIVFLDEPTSGLDPVGAAAFDELVLELKELLGLTVVMITHDPDTLWQASDRVAFLAEKRVVAIAPVAELIREQQTDIQRYFSSARTQDRRTN